MPTIQGVNIPAGASADIILPAYPTKTLFVNTDDSTAPAQGVLSVIDSDGNVTPLENTEKFSPTARELLDKWICLLRDQYDADEVNEILSNGLVFGEGCDRVYVTSVEGAGAQVLNCGCCDDTISSNFCVFHVGGVVLNGSISDFALSNATSGNLAAPLSFVSNATFFNSFEAALVAAGLTNITNVGAKLVNASLDLYELYVIAPSGNTEELVSITSDGATTLAYKTCGAQSYLEGLGFNFQ